DHEGVDHEGVDHEGVDHEGVDHEGMDHEGMDMPMPGGIGLASGQDDRDGLEMDVLHVPLGPVLPHWPAGLVLTCTLSGDVVVDATAEILDGGADHDGTPPEALSDDPRRDVVASRCDDAAGVLALAGWGSAAAEALAVRDRCLEGVPLEDCATALRRLARRVERSRTLRWSLHGLGVREDPSGADVLDRLRHRLREALSAADPAAGAAPGGCAAVPPEDLPDLVTGLDLGAVRLVVASLDVDAAALRSRREEDARA
ncbi:hypothetical protein MO973_03750, partial [Paenibacillus sp. TRM 82003]|uniref:hypothetical protein n=1 Tax=Kineococcus sp. TRM81007 TaxID=2925831 RepID=UPI001F55F4E7